MRRAIGATAKEMIFTSGATESNNLAIKGVAEMYAQKGNHIITAATEHKAVLDTCKRLEKHGCRVTYLPVQPNGLIDLDMLRDAITDKTILISIMYANNEIGVIQPIREIGKIAREKRRAVPHRRRAGVRQGSRERQRRATSTCFRSRRTRFTVPRASARCTSGGATRACRSPPRWTAAATSAACAPAR